MERRDASLNSELAEAAITEETHVLHPSENNLGMNVYTTIINLSPGKKGLQHLLYIIKQNKFFYLGKFYSSKKKKKKLLTEMGPAKSTLTNSEIKGEPG